MTKTKSTLVYTQPVLLVLLFKCVLCVNWFTWFVCVVCEVVCCVKPVVCKPKYSLS